MKPYYQRDSVTLYHGDCLAVLPSLTANSVDLVLTDPPYFKVKNEAWDRQWATPKAFLSWLDRVTAECHRLLKPNGSLYCFASPQMAARVEVQIAERFNVLNHIVWRKDYSRHRQAEKEALRGFFPQTERITFAEHYGADDLRGPVFEPLRAYLDCERASAGLSRADVDLAWQSERGTKGCMSPHWFGQSQFGMPTRAHYAFFRRAAPGRFLRDYDELWREYESLAREYESVRRQFSVTTDVPYTDVWDFKPVAAYPGKHPCEKPAALLSHMLTASSRPGAVVLDMFAGSGATLDAALKLRRQAIGVELSEQWCEKIARRLEAADTLLPLEASA
jgi:adenine-specific DNA-methyltransferase